MILRRTARDLGPAGADGRGGAGALDARAAVAAVLGARAPRPELSLIATPPALTHRAVLTFALESGGAPLGVWLDGARVAGLGNGPFVRVPVGTPGRHTVSIAALDRAGAVLDARRHFFPVTIDRERPRLRLVVRRGGLLEIGYRARAADAVAGLARGSLRVRLSESPNLRGAPAGGHTFTGPGPYWVEAEVADRAGNVRRVRRALSWPAGPVARRVAWNDAFVQPAGAVPHGQAPPALRRPLPDELATGPAPGGQLRAHGLRRDADPELAAPARRGRRLERRAHAGAPRDRASGPPLRHGGPGRPGEHGGAALAAAQEVGALLRIRGPGPCTARMGTEMERPSHARAAPAT